MVEVLNPVGNLTISDWTKARVLINGAILNRVIDINAVRSSDIQAGVANIKVADPQRVAYDAISAGDQIDIYMASSGNIKTGNKIWGGRVANKSFTGTGQKILNIMGKEHTQTLISIQTPETLTVNENSFTTTEAGEIILALMNTYQSEFTTDQVLTGTANTLTVDFKSMTLFAALKLVCDTFDYVFYIDNNKDLVVRERTTVVNAPSSDYITWGVNVQSLTVEQNVEFIANDITVYGNSNTISGSAEDAISINAYGRKPKNIVKNAFDTAIACQSYADAYLAMYKNPIPVVTSKTRPQIFCDPLQYIQVTSAQHGLNSSYQIRSIEYEYGTGGFYTKFILANNIPNLTQSLGTTEVQTQSTDIQSIQSILPDQTGHSGEFLQTDGSNVSWAAASASGVRNSCAQLVENADNTNPIKLRFYVAAVTTVSARFKMLIKGYRTFNSFAGPEDTGSTTSTGSSSAGSSHRHSIPTDITVTATSTDSGTFGDPVTDITVNSTPSTVTGDITYASFRTMCNSSGTALRTSGGGNTGYESAHTHTMTMDAHTHTIADLTETKAISDTAQTSPSILVKFDGTTTIDTYTSDQADIDFSSTPTWTTGWHYLEFIPASGQKLALDVSVYLECQ